MPQKKGLDGKFLHYGIRQSDLEVIAGICKEEGLDPGWVQENLLKAFHAKKVNEIEVTDKSVEKVVKDALKFIN